MEKRVKKVRRLNIKALIVLLLIIYLIVMFFYTFLTMPIKNIYINNTKLLTDNEIITIAGIKKYPSLFKTSTKKLEEKISTLELVSNVKVKKNLLGKITIDIEEAKPLFYNRNTSTYVLSNGKETNKYSFVGVPFLINYVPDKIYNRFIKELKNVDTSSLEMVSEIEYFPSRSKDDVIIDDTRFLLRMNDGNQVYINLINIDRLNSYPLIYTILTEKGVLELDSDNERVVFKSYQSIIDSQNKEEGDPVE